MKIQFLTSNIPKTMGQKNLKKFRGIQNKLYNILGKFKEDLFFDLSI